MRFSVMEEINKSGIVKAFSPGTIWKSELREILKLNHTYFSKQLIIIEPELIKNFPGYERMQKYLNPNQARFIAYELGYEDAELVELFNNWRENRQNRP